MKHSMYGTMLSALLALVSLPAMAQVDVRVGIGLPPPIVFRAAPELVVIPETYVYAVPDIDEDVYFYDGWWWRLWEGRWYRSRSYSGGWGYYQSVPAFYTVIPWGWRDDFRNHRWRGYAWNYQRIPHYQVQQNWRQWERSRYWENQHTWGVQGLQPRAQWRERPGTANPQYQQRMQGQQQPQQAYTPQYQQRPQAQPRPEGYNPQYQNQPRPQAQARPPEGNAPYPQRQQGGPRPQDGSNPQYQTRQPTQSAAPEGGRPQYQPRGQPQSQPRGQPQAAPPPQPAVQGQQPAQPPVARAPRPQGAPPQPREGRPESKPEKEGDKK